MNDAFRGGVIVIALAAFYLASRLSIVHLRHWRNDNRRHVMVHVFLLTLGLVVTAGIVVYTIGDAAGENAPLSGREIARVVQMSLICAGLRPLWLHHRALAARRHDRSKDETL